MTRADKIALSLSLLAALVAYQVADRVFERIAHIEDEMAYVWQAQAIANGRWSTPIPPVPKSFLVPFVVDYNGQRFGKYPPGWPVILGIGVWADARSLVNPLLAALGVWFTYRLGKRIFGECVGLLAAGLTIPSPFFLMNSGSLLSHPLGLVLSAAFALAWIDRFGDLSARSAPSKRDWLPTLAAAGSLGLLALTRPLTAVGVGLPFALHGAILFFRRYPDLALRRSTRLHLLALGAIALLIGCLLFAWQWAVTGDPFLNPYTLWWPYDKIGFGTGVGRIQGGHSLYQAYINTRHSLQAGFPDLFGWGYFSLCFIPLGLITIRRNPLARLPASVFPSLVLVYLAYWIGSSLYGPRYYYEGLYSLTLLTAAGIAWAAGWPTRPGDPWPVVKGRVWARPFLVTVLVSLLVSTNILYYVPLRVGGMHGLYGVQRTRLEPFLAPATQSLTPALIIVHPKKWTEYGALLDLENPMLNTPFIFVYTGGVLDDQAVAAAFPQRTVYHYYPAEPYVFYSSASSP